MKTAMQILVEEMNKSPMMFSSALTLINSLYSLSQERKQIEDAFEEGDWTRASQTASDYYTKTFNSL